MTARAIRALKPRDHAYLVPDGRGLYLKVQPGGARSWLLRYQIAGKVHDLGLGSYPESNTGRIPRSRIGPSTLITPNVANHGVETGKAVIWATGGPVIIG
jgi:Arm DNA-binding domain